MKIGKREVVIAFVVLSLLVLTIFFPNLRLSQEQNCGECTEWETIGCGLEEYNCSELELTQIRSCVYPDVQNLPIGDEPLFSAPKEMGLDIAPKEKPKEEPAEEIQEGEEESIEESLGETSGDETQEKSTQSTSSSSGGSNSRKTPPVRCLSRCIPKATACNTPPEQPSNPSPSNSQTNVLISSELSWTGSDVNSEQELEYDIYFGVESLGLISTQSETNYSFSELLNYSTTYNWQVIISDGYDATVGQTWHFTTEPEPNTPPEQPSNPSPVDGAQEVDLLPTLTWTCSDDGELFYDIYFGTNNSGLHKLLEDQIEPSYGVIQELDYSTTYYWKIIAKDNEYETEGLIWNFTTGIRPNSPPTSITNFNPEYGSINLPINLALSWSVEDPEGDDMSYDVFLDNSTNLTVPISSGQEDKIITISRLDYSTTYYWKIRAIDEHNAATESDIIKFRTREEPIIAETRGTDPYALFDIKVDLFNESKISHPGEDIWADIVMYNMGTLKPVDVVIDCTLEDMNGTMYDYFQETLAVEEQTAMNRSMTIPLAAKLDYYVYQCVLSYYGEVAVSSDLFETEERIISIEEPKEDYSKLYKTILALFIVIIILLFLLIRKQPKKKRKTKKKKRRKKKSKK
ncbi:hypothetical protein HN412_01215 [archaeon]|nr:hypothetical protein [archaeon]